MDMLSYESLFEILLHVTDVTAVNRFCSTNRLISQIYHDDYFWNRRFHRIYPNLNGLFPRERKTYKWVVSIYIGKQLLFHSITDKRVVIQLVNPRTQYAVV
jgi:hypothetical protein